MQWGDLSKGFKLPSFNPYLDYEKFAVSIVWVIL